MFDELIVRSLCQQYSVDGIMDLFRHIIIIQYSENDITAHGKYMVNPHRDVEIHEEVSQVKNFERVSFLNQTVKFLNAS